MGRKAPGFCRAPGCGSLVNGGGWCDRHQPQQRADVLAGQRDYNKRRAESDSLYRGSRWRRLSVAFRKRHPLCCECERQGLVRPADLVDHIKPAKLFPDLFYDWGNLRSLCQACHNRVGARVYSGSDDG